jgi:hypothetical protein
MRDKMIVINRTKRIHERDREEAETEARRPSRPRELAQGIRERISAASRRR